MTGQLFTHYFLTDGIRATPEWQASALLTRRPSPPSGNPSSSANETLARVRRPQRGGHRAGPDPAGPGAARMGRLPAAAEDGRQRGHPRPPALRGPRLQGAGLRGAQRRRPRRVRNRPGGEQALRPVPGRARQGGRIPRPVPPQPDPPLPGHGRDRVGEPAALGPAHQRPHLAPVRLPRPAPGQRLLRGRPWRTCSNPAAKRTCASSTCSSAGSPSRPRKAPPSPSSKRPWPRAAATRSRSPRICRGWSSRASSRPSSRPSPTPRRREAPGPACRRSTRRPSSSSTACSSCSTPRTGGCCRSTTPATTTTACASGCGTTSPAGWRRATPSQRWPPTTTTASSISSASSTRATRPSACPPTTAGCSPGKPRRCWRRSASPTPRWLP